MLPTKGNCLILSLYLWSVVLAHNDTELSESENKVVSGVADVRRQVVVFSSPDYGNERAQSTESTDELIRDTSVVTVSFRTTVRMECRNIPKRNVLLVRSIDTEGTCVVVFRKRNCQGQGMRILRHDLNAMDMEGIQSTRLCDETDIHTIIIYTRNKYQGESQVIAVTYSGRCETFRDDMQKRVSSIKFMNPDSCIIVYSEPDCSGQPTRLYSRSHGVRRLRKISRANALSSVQLCTAVDGNGMNYVQDFEGNQAITSIKDNIHIDLEPSSKNNETFSFIK